jgi:isopropylmalate/homocitrate/citramalate synthase
VVPFVTELVKIMQETGVPIKIRMCDTLGYGVPYPGAALPRSVPGIVYGLRFYAGVPSELLEWHGHNDFHKGVVNASTAWLYGASSVNCSLLGIGERTGNVPLEAMAMEYAQLKGNDGGMNLEKITEIARYFEEKIGYTIDPRTPFVGSSFNMTRAGIHADGMMKDEEIYNIFDTKKILDRPAGVMLGEHSGAAGIAYWINTYFGLTGDRMIDKRDPVVDKVKALMDREYERGRNTLFSNREMEGFVKTADSSLYMTLKH